MKFLSNQNWCYHNIILKISQGMVKCMKKELLSPVGSFEALRMAVFHGADAVYLGGKKFGARAFAQNFDEAEMKEAIFFCHLYGVKIYVTVNTMIYESEMLEVLSYVEFLYRNHVDAIIMADIGLMKVCHEKFPNLEIHASTQVHTHNLKQLTFLKKLGVKRVVLARELSLEEIKKFPNDMDIEVFIHGALCISYSGQCLFSSLLMNRSGNRGECAQICRLPFTLLKNGKEMETEGNYLLSTKDLNTADRFADLMNSNITSFKIEGRMKSPAYVGFMTNFYRHLMDHYENGKEFLISSKEEKDVKSLFNRGFTSGNLFSKKDQSLMNQITSNHQGSYLGEIESLDSKKIGIRLHEDLHQEDGIRFQKENQGMIVNFLYNQRGLLISGAKKGDLVFVDNKLGILAKGHVMKTFDKHLETEVLTCDEKKIPVWMQLVLKENFIQLKISDGVSEIVVDSDLITKSKNCPLTKEVIQKQFGKLGSTPFYLREMNISMKNDLFMSVRDMNELRRVGIEKLIQKRTYREEAVIQEEVIEHFSYDDKFLITASARNEEQIQTILSLGITEIYVDDYAMYQKYQENGVIYRTNRVNHFGKYHKATRILAGESGALLADPTEQYLDYFFNVANHFTADFWVKQGVRRICLTPEMNEEELSCLLSHYSSSNPFELIVYGRLEAMVMNHCLIRMNEKLGDKCKACKYGDNYSLKDRNGKIYPIKMDEFHRTHLFYYDCVNLLQNAKKYYQLGLRKFRFEFFDESSNEVKEVVKQLQNILKV